MGMAELGLTPGSMELDDDPHKVEKVSPAKKHVPTDNLNDDFVLVRFNFSFLYSTLKASGGGGGGGVSSSFSACVKTRETLWYTYVH